MGVRRTWSVVSLCTLVLPIAGAQPGSQPKSGAIAGGVFVLRSGKPMAKARLFLGAIAGDREVTYARIKLLSAVSVAACDDQGRFQLNGFPPGQYTIVYQPAGTTTALPSEIIIKPFLAVTRSIAPEMRGLEVGTTFPFPQRAWGGAFTLLKGHTFYSEGPNMKIWNATVRRGLQGPYMEIRRGLIWVQQIDHNSQIKFEAWSY